MSVHLVRIAGDGLEDKDVIVDEAGLPSTGKEVVVVVRILNLAVTDSNNGVERSINIGSRVGRNGRSVLALVVAEELGDLNERLVLHADGNMDIAVTNAEVISHLVALPVKTDRVEPVGEASVVVGRGGSGVKELAWSVDVAGGVGGVEGRRDGSGSVKRALEHLLHG